MTVETSPDVDVSQTIPPLRPGDRLCRAEFERRYNAMPEVNKAELLEGVVYMPSPVTTDHGNPHFDLIGWLGLYRFATPGVTGDDNTTVRLDGDNNPQPDIHLRILPTHGGRAQVSADRYVVGGPELVAEVAVTSIAVDLNIRLPIYRRNGVAEYIVWRVPDRAIDWFVLRGTQYEPLPLSGNGIYKSEVFPGLWLDPAALIRGDTMTVLQVAQRGLASPEHAAFIKRLQAEAARRTS